MPSFIVPKLCLFYLKGSSANTMKRVPAGMALVTTSIADRKYGLVQT
jgi:hypothetical protein